MKKLVFEDKKLTLEEYREALRKNFGRGLGTRETEDLVAQVAGGMAAAGQPVGEAEIRAICEAVRKDPVSPAEKAKYDQLLDWIDELPKYGNDVPGVDAFAREVAYLYTRPLQNYRQPARRHLPGGALPRLRQRGRSAPRRAPPPTAGSPTPRSPTAWAPPRGATPTARPRPATRRRGSTT